MIATQVFTWLVIKFQLRRTISEDFSNYIYLSKNDFHNRRCFTVKEENNFGYNSAEIAMSDICACVRVYLRIYIR
jgi:hypothetical protein